LRSIVESLYSCFIYIKFDSGFFYSKVTCTYSRPESILVHSWVNSGKKIFFLNFSPKLKDIADLNYNLSLYIMQTYLEWVKRLKSILHTSFNTPLNSLIDRHQELRIWKRWCFACFKYIFILQAWYRCNYHDKKYIKTQHLVMIELSIQNVVISECDGNLWKSPNEWNILIFHLIYIQARLEDIEKIVCTSSSDIQRLTKLSLSDVTLLHQVASTAIPRPPVQTALELYQSDYNTHITTGCNILDKALRGGIPCNGITEITGESASGKTQLCLQLCLSVQLPRDRGGLGRGKLNIYLEGLRVGQFE